MVKFFLVIGIASFLLLSGCNSKTVIDGYIATETVVQLGEDESIVVLGRRHQGGYETEHDFVECIGETLSKTNNDLKVIPEKQFVDSLYPYFEARTAPLDIKNLDKLIKNPIVAARFEDFNLRYFIWIDGKTETISKEGGISCGAGPSGAACFGYATWDDEANYEASIWDFNQIQISGKINTETRGTSYLPAIIIPIPMLAQVQEAACKELSEQISTYFFQQD